LSAAARIVVLGGYGHFGTIAARRLLHEPDFEMVIAGRDAVRAREAAARLGCAAACLDRNEPSLGDRLRELGATLVMDLAGPFQGRNYAVPQAAAAARAHCVDIADARPYVTGIGGLSREARAQGVALVSGASSVPALTSAVVDHLARGLATVERIDMGISTSGCLPGAATVDAVLSYCGEPIPAWRDCAAGESRGWTGLRRRDIAGLGRRWIVDADVPDLDLLPARYPQLRELRFGAGSESKVLVGMTWLWARGRALGLVPPLRRAPRALLQAWRACAPSTGRSALFAHVEGTDASGARRHRSWTLVASDGDGANIPVLPAIALARRLARGGVPCGFAQPCVGLLSLDEIRAEMEGLRVRVYENEETT
jgi:hypothetical protein